MASYIPGCMSATTIRELKRIRDSFLAEITCPQDIASRARAAHPLSGRYQPFTHEVKREPQHWQCYHCKKRFTSEAACERHYRNKSVINNDIPLLMPQSHKGCSISAWKRQLKRINEATLNCVEADEKEKKNERTTKAS